MTRDRIILVLKLALAAGLIAWLLATGKLEFGELANIGERWSWLLVAQVPFGIVMFIAAVRWRLLLKAQAIDSPLRDTYSLSMIGLFFNQMVPGSTGGDVYKAYAIARAHPECRSGGVVSVFVDRALGLIVLLLVVAAGMLWNLEWVRQNVELASFGAVIAAILGGLTVGAVVFYSKRLRRARPIRWLLSRLPFQVLLKKIDQAVFVYRYHLAEVIWAVILSVALHLLVVTTNVCLAIALLPDAFEWWHFFYLIPMAHFAMAIPINPPGALGTAEAIYAYLLELVAIPLGGLLCILQRLTYYSWSLLGAVFYVLRKRRDPGVATLTEGSKDAAVQ